MKRTIEVEYILKDAEGKEVARFQDIEEARKYDRMLDAADGIFNLFSGIKELDGVKENVKDERMLRMKSLFRLPVTVRRLWRSSAE